MEGESGASSESNASALAIDLCSILLYECAGFAFPSALYAMVKIEQYIGTVYDNVHHSGHDKCGGHVEHGMLLDEHGR